MKQIKVRLDDDEYEIANVFFKKMFPNESGMNPSKGMKLLLSLMVGNEAARESLTSYDGGAKNRFSVSIGEKAKKTIEESARKHRWSLSKEIRFRINSTIEGNFDVFDEELKLIYNTKNSIDKVGRNIRHVIVANQNMILDSEDFKSDVRDLNVNLESLRTEMTRFIAMCGSRFVSNSMRVKNDSEG